MLHPRDHHSRIINNNNNIYIYIWDLLLYSFSAIFGFCLIWALGGSHIGQKDRGWLNEILLEGSLASPSGELHLRKTHPPIKSYARLYHVNLCHIL